jgi:hypothetical protein
MLNFKGYVLAPRLKKRKKKKKEKDNIEFGKPICNPLGPMLEHSLIS